MPDALALARGGLDRTTLSAFREQIAAFEADAASSPSAPPRTYPGYPRWPLPTARQRPWPSLDAALARRQAVRTLSTRLPSRRALARLLAGAHGITHGDDRGPTPSSGGLQSLELYAVVVEPAWLPAGVYHYDRAGHHLSQLAAGATRDEWRAHIPSMHQFEGGALLWLLIGDQARLGIKYGDRSHRFLLLEAGHLMQNLCLLCASLALCTLPLGGYLEGDIARALHLPPADLVLYAGVCGKPVAG
jgi:SagB-type dehydrogenase family enzyme